MPEWILKLTGAARTMAETLYPAVLDKLGDAEKAGEAVRTAMASMIDSDSGALAADSGREMEGLIHFRASQAEGDEMVWDAILIEPGLSKGWPRFYWAPEVLQEAVPMFDQVDINAYEVTADFFSHLRIPNMDVLEDVKRLLTARKVGQTESPEYRDNIGIGAVVRFLPGNEWIPKSLSAGMSRNQDVLGLSIDSRVKGIEVPIDGDSVVYVTKIVSVSSVDVVTRPAAGGRFLRAMMAEITEEHNMDRKKLLALIQKARPNLLAGKDQDKLTDDEVLLLAQQAMEAAADETATRAAQDIAGLTQEQVQKKIDEAVKASELRAACSIMLSDELERADLPKPAADRIRTMFKDKTFKAEELTEAIKSEKDYLATMAAPGAMPGFEGGQDGTRVAVGLGTLPKIQAAVDRLFGFNKEEVTKMAGMCRLDGKPYFPELRAAQAIPDDYDKLPRLSGMRELYVLLSGDPEITGQFNRKGVSADLRAAQDFTSATFTYLLGNTMGRRVIAEYRAADFMEDLLISTRKPVKDFRTQEAVKIGYFGDLDDVNPETGDYQEADAITDEESTYSVGQKGNLLTISRKVIINDDVSLVNRLLSRRGRAARRTHAKYVWTFWTGNDTCSDGTAWHTVGHGNLTASALAIATALAAFQALAKMTEKDSGERIAWSLGASIKPILIYPVDLMATAESIINDEFYYSANDLTTKTRNPLQGKITGAQVPLLTDANDWGLLLPASEVDHVEMGYLNGNQEPEVFVADAPNSEQMFVADKIRHKIRHEYGGAVVDCVGSYKGEVA